jgi:hypothetical protein
MVHLSIPPFNYGAQATIHKSIPSAAGHHHESFTRQIVNSFQCMAMRHDAPQKDGGNPAAITQTIACYLTGI